MRVIARGQQPLVDRIMGCSWNPTTVLTKDKVRDTVMVRTCQGKLVARLAAVWNRAQLVT